MSYDENPKTKDSGIKCSAPQTSLCPRQCRDCYAVKGRAYTELPNILPEEEAVGYVVRMNDLNDSCHHLELVLETADLYDDVFLNTSFTELFDKVTQIPAVLTVNPGPHTDHAIQKLGMIPTNLMFVRVRVNPWNWPLVCEAVEHYTNRGCPVVLTFMAYYETPIPDIYKEWYRWEKRTTNSYWCLEKHIIRDMENCFWDNPRVYSCGYRGEHPCKRCGNCLQMYHETKERLRNGKR